MLDILAILIFNRSKICKALNLRICFLKGMKKAFQNKNLLVLVELTLENLRISFRYSNNQMINNLRRNRIKLYSNYSRASRNSQILKTIELSILAIKIIKHRESCLSDLTYFKDESRINRYRICRMKINFLFYSSF